MQSKEVLKTDRYVKARITRKEKVAQIRVSKEVRYGFNKGE